MTSAVLYGTTSDNELRPVRVTDSGEFVTDGGGGGDWYENFYVGGTEGAPSISLLSDGSIESIGSATLEGNVYSSQEGDPFGGTNTGCALRGADGLIATGSDANAQIIRGYTKGLANATCSIRADGTSYFALDVYARNFIPSSGFDLNKIGQALSTIYDVIDSVDDLQGLKNLFHLLLDNLKSDPSPPPLE